MEPVYPFSYRLRRPKYIFSEDGTDAFDDKLRGLLKYQPLRFASTNSPRCLFVFSDDDRDHANKLVLSLRNGVAKFPGCKRLLGVTLDNANVQAVRVNSKADNVAREFAVSLEDYFSEHHEKPDFAFVINSKRPLSITHDPYPFAKAVLTRHGVPSQYVSWELLDSENQFVYAISNIALNFFVKLGGVPWGVSVQKSSPSIVLGVGGTQLDDPKSNTKRRLIGFAVCVLSNGVYLDTDFFAPAIDYEGFITSLKAGLSSTLQKMLSLRQDVNKVTIHVSRFERKVFIEAIKSTISQYEKDIGPVPYEIIRITNDSDFSVLDNSHPGFVSEEGTVVALGDNHALLVAEGRREAAVWRGRKPVTLEIHRERVSTSVPRLKESLEETFALSTVNWRGFNSVTQPMTLQYAKLLSDVMVKMSKYDENFIDSIKPDSALNKVPWFI